MKNSIAVVLVFAVVAAVGFAGFWFGRSSQPAHQQTGVASSTTGESEAVAPATPPATSGIKGSATTSSKIASDSSATRQNGGDHQNTVHASAVQAQLVSTSAPSAELHARIAARFDELDSDNPKRAIQSPNVAAHQLVLTQPVDPTWSPVVDQAIADRLSDDLGNQFNIESIECKTDICELRAYGYLPDSQQGPDNFQQEMYNLQGQGWFGQYGLQFENFLISGVDGGGPSVFIVYLTRK